MSWTKCRTLRKLPSRTTSRVRSAKKPLHQVQPGTRRGGKMHVKTRVTLHPRADVGVFVSAVVVRDHVDFQVLGGLPIDLLEKAQPLHMGMFRLGTTDDLPFQVVQGRKQGNGAMADVVMGLLSECAQPPAASQVAYAPTLGTDSSRRSTRSALSPVDRGTNR